MTKYRNTERDAQLDAELAAEEAAYRKQFGEQPDTVEEKEPPANTEEEETWKKRHSDLRSYSQRQLNERDAKITELEKAIKEKTSDPRMPLNIAEAEQWVKDYPDLARVMQTLMDTRAEQKISSVSDEVKDVKMQLEAEREAMAHERAMSQIIKAHPDFLDLVGQKEFQEWVEDQPRKRGSFGEFLYRSLYENKTDAQSAIEAVNIYKADKGGTKKPPVSNREAALSVRTPSSMTPPSSGNRNVWKESDIEKLSNRDFEKYEDDIENARREGRFEYDISGAAR